MKKTFLKKCLFSVSSLLLVTGSALAMPTVGQYVKIDTSHGLGNANGGGEFLLDVGNKNLDTTYTFDGNVDYISFCLEVGEHIYTANTFNNSLNYYIESVSDNVYGGGLGAVDGYDLLEDATQWVYYKYMFTDYFGTHTDVLANQIQEVIWYLEKEITTFTDGAQKLYDTKVSGKTNNFYNAYVTAINLKNGNTPAQSQLIGEKAPVPEPTTMLLFGTGIAGLAGIARRKRD